MPPSDHTEEKRDGDREEKEEDREDREEEEGPPKGGGKAGARGGKKKEGGGKGTKVPVWSLPTNMTPTFYIGGGNGTALVEGPLLAMGWKRITDKTDNRFKLKWAECKSKINYANFKEGEQLVNHIPNGKLLTNKLGLLCSLQEFERVTLSTKGRLPRMRMTDFFPETYRLDSKEDRSTFLEHVYKEGETWICKPIGWNQGKGIFLLRSRQEIDQLLEERDAQREKDRYSVRQPVERLVQRYIPNPLLLEGRKFDIRAYMLIASTVPYLILFQHGYIRLSCNKYDTDDTNLTTHLTNQYIQKKDPGYQEVKESTAWSMEKFNEYLNTHYSAKKGIEEDWTFKSLTKQMHRIILHCFNSVRHKLQCKIGFFDLYGLDFMIDSNMKVWLIEMNVNPSLDVNCSALKNVIPGVVKETLHVTIEAFEKTRRNQPLLPLQSLKGFQILHCGSFPSNVRIPRQSRSVSPVKREISPSPGRSPPPGQNSPGWSRHNSLPRGVMRVNVSASPRAIERKSPPSPQQTHPKEQRVPATTADNSDPDRGDTTGGPYSVPATRKSPNNNNNSNSNSRGADPNVLRYSAPETLPRMKLFSSDQVSPYIRPYQGGNPGGLLASNHHPARLPSSSPSSQPTSLPSIVSHSNHHHPHHYTSKTTTITTNYLSSSTPSTVTIVFPFSTTYKRDSDNNSSSNVRRSLSGPEGEKEKEKERERVVTLGGVTRTRIRSATSGGARRRRKKDKPDRGN